MVFGLSCWPDDDDVDDDGDVDDDVDDDGGVGDDGDVDDDVDVDDDDEGEHAFVTKTLKTTFVYNSFLSSQG